GCTSTSTTSSIRSSTPGAGSRKAVPGTRPTLSGPSSSTTRRSRSSSSPASSTTSTPSSWASFSPSPCGTQGPACGSGDAPPPRSHRRPANASEMPDSTHRPRLLIFVIAYQAEATLAEVLDRIPRSVFDDWDCEILVVDDASRDRTFDIGQAYDEAHPELTLTVLRNTYNQGYGGNQKVAYAYPIAHTSALVP